MVDSVRRECHLADGRTLTYIEVGDPLGSPVLHHHGGLVSSTDVVACHQAAVAAGVRWISFDRPGIGGSTPLAGRTVAGGGADAQELLDFLGVAQVRVTGWSMGGPYALATAHRLADRVRRVAVIAGALPLDDPRNLSELNAMDRRFTAMAEHASPALRAAATVLGGIASVTPSVWARVAAKGEGQADEAAVREAATELSASAHDATRHSAGIVEEYRAWARPWGFDPHEIPSPVDIWQGSEDRLVPRGWADRLAGMLSDAHVHHVAGAGHFLLLEHADVVLGALLADGAG